ncbi:hypothetical protein SK128_028276, partial [Halocaridina rubra]
LNNALRRNGTLRYLEELRIGLQRNLDIDHIAGILYGTKSLKILGRTDWWFAVDPEDKLNIIQDLKS